MAGSVADRLVDALSGAHTGLLCAAVALHVGAQVCRGLAWRGVLAAAWPGVTRRRACAWHVCGSGLSGLFTARGGEAVRIALAKRDLRDATWPGLAGTLAAEGSFETFFGLLTALVAVRLGVGTPPVPPPAAIAAVAVAAPVLALLAARCARVRRVAREVAGGLAVLRRPRCWAVHVLPWQFCARLLRIGAATCLLLAFGLPAAPAVVVAACAAGGSGAAMPLPGAGPAAMGAALLVAIPLAAAAAGQPVDHGAVAALAIAWPTVLTAVGATLSLVLLAVLSGARSPRALVHAVRALRTPPAAPAAPAPAPAPLAP
jgi:hypothetical protein